MIVYDQGDVIIVSFDPSKGHEPRKSRPAVVVSTLAFNLRSSLTYVAPVTSVRNGYPLHVPITSDSAGVEGDVCVEAIAAKDFSARPTELVGRLSVEDMSEVLNVLAPVFGL